MKAKMSIDSSRHQYFEDANGPSAVAEARAILQEVEPKGAIGDTYSGPLTNSFSRCGEAFHNERGALAEATVRLIAGIDAILSEDAPCYCAGEVLICLDCRIKAQEKSEETRG